MIVAQEKSVYSPDHFEPSRACEKGKPRQRIARPVRSRNVLVFAGFILICLSLAIFVTLYFANLVKLGYDLGNLEKELALLEKENHALENCVAEFTSLECIESVALLELGMVKPGKDDIIFVPLEPASLAAGNVFNEEQAVIAENAEISTAQGEGSWIIQAFTDLIARAGIQQPGVKGEA